MPLANWSSRLRSCTWLLITIAATGCGDQGGIPPTTAADRILVNGKIITVDEQDTIAEALAIKDGRILAVGSNAEVKALAGPDTDHIDLQGLTATPGLLDAHAHFARGGVYLRYELDLSFPGVKFVTDAVNKVQVKADELQEGEWIFGRGWDEGKLAENRYIYASDLDPVTPEHPVYLSHTMGHYGVANSLALQMANITRATPDPPGGTIDRGPDGEPTGVLKEAAQSLVMDLMPRVDAEKMQQGIKQISQAFNREGMTGVKDPAIDGDVWEAYRTVLADGELTVRVFALWRAGKTIEAAQDLIDRIGPFSRPDPTGGDKHLISGGVKLFADGSGGARTGWLYEDWNRHFDGVDEGNRGYPAVDPDILREQIRMFHDAGLHIGTHAVGDRAIDWVVDSYIYALEATPTPGLRHSIIHANIPTDQALDKIADLQARYDVAYPEPSATFMWWIGDTYAGNYGPRRSRRLNPFKTYLDRGIRWAGGSDFGVTPFPARFGLWASVERETLLGTHGTHPYGEQESIDVRSALRSYTIWVARQMFLEQDIGSLEVGKLADIAVWDRDLYSIGTAQIKDMRCVMTLFGGEIVYRAPEDLQSSAPAYSRGRPPK